MTVIWNFTKKSKLGNLNISFGCHSKFFIQGFFWWQIIALLLVTEPLCGFSVFIHSLSIQLCGEQLSMGPCCWIWDGFLPRFCGAQIFQKEGMVGVALIWFDNQSVVGGQGHHSSWKQWMGRTSLWCECLLLVCCFSLWVWLSRPSVSLNTRNVVAVQLLTGVRLCDPMNCSTPGFAVLH